MKLAVFGGSFNPLHISHAMLAETVIKELGYDKVLFVPAFMPPHKIMSGAVTPQQRLEMLRCFCASEGDGKYEVESSEIDREGVSYTYDTVSWVAEKYKGKLDGKPAVIMGDEIAAEFEKWKNPDGIVEIADLLITARYPDIESLKATAQNNKATGNYSGAFKEKFDLETFKYKDHCIYLDKPLLPVSSTEIRERIAAGQSYKYLVPQPIFEYIEKNGLYRNN